MSKIKSVSSASEFYNAVNGFAVEIVSGENSVRVGYAGIAQLCLDKWHDAEIESGQTFERITRASSGDFASKVNADRDVIEKIFEKAGHKQPRGAYLKIQRAADELRNGKAQQGSSDTRAFKPINEFVTEKLIALYNKAVRQANENKTVDSFRSEWLAQLNKLGVKSDSKKLANNK